MFERKAANDLLVRHWSGRPIPVDASDIARREGIELVPCTAAQLQGASGWYLRNQGARPRILYNVQDPPNRQRFTIAHELGHHALGHQDSPRDTAAAFSTATWDPKEVAANRFAAELLMPEFAVKTLVLDRRISSTTELARAFHVSDVAMSYRLKNLGLAR